MNTQIFRTSKERRTCRLFYRGSTLHRRYRRQLSDVKELAPPVYGQEAEVAKLIEWAPVAAGRHVQQAVTAYCKQTATFLRWDEVRRGGKLGIRKRPERNVWMCRGKRI